MPIADIGALSVDAAVQCAAGDVKQKSAAEIERPRSERINPPDQGPPRFLPKECAWLAPSTPDVLERFRAQWLCSAKSTAVPTAMSNFNAAKTTAHINTHTVVGQQREA